MDMKKMGTALLTGVLAASLLAGCGSSQKDAGDANKPLRVATNATFVPFEFKDSDQSAEYKGFEMDLIRAVAKEMNRDVEFNNIAFSGIIPEEQGYNVKQFDNNSEAIMELQVGGSPAAIIDKPVADYFLTQDGKDKFDVIDISNTKPEYLAFALNKDNKELLQQVNEAMEKLKKSGEFQQIYKKWFNTDMPDLPTSADAVLK